MLINCSYTVFPEKVFPFFRGEFILKHPFIPVEGDHLAGFLFHRHLLQQIFYPVFQGGCRIFIDILDSVLVEVYPAFFVDVGATFSGGCLGGGDCHYGSP